jgi:RNA polymerase sigma-70 factor (ECF subfamily)
VKPDGDSQSAPIERLLAAAANRDAIAFRRLYEATSGKLFAIILRIIGNRGIAEEVLQETYVKVWQNAEKFSPDAGKPIVWLSAVARNAAIDRLRGERIARASGSDDEAVLARLAAPDAIDIGSREALRRCLSGLDEEAQRCVVLAYCSGFSREELAERFGRPVGTIKTLLHRSLKQLRECLERQ